MAYCVKFFSDSSYSEIPKSWLIDDHHCWWPKTKNPLSYMAKNIVPQCDGMWTKYEITIEKYCSTLSSARRYASDANYVSTTDNEDNKGRGKRKKFHKLHNETADVSDTSSAEEYQPPPKVSISGESTAGISSINLAGTSLLTEVPEVNKNISQPTIDIPLEGDLDDNNIIGLLSTPSDMSTNDNLLNTKLYDMFSHIKLSLKSIDQRLQKLEEKKVSENGIDFSDIEEMLPIDCLGKLNDLERFVTTAENSYKFQLYLKTTGGRDGKDFCIRCLKKIFTNKLAIHCSWLGQRQNIKIGNLKCISIIKNIATSQFNNCTEALIQHVGSEWFRQAKLRFNREKEKKRGS